MKSRTSARQNILAKQSRELATAVPQVVAHRVTRMVMAGAQPSERDRVEFQRMVDEKHLAFNESWAAMSAQALQANQTLFTTAWRSFCYPWLDGGATPSAMAEQMQAAGLRVIQKGLTPVHRRAVANAKRLAKTPLV